MLQAGQAAPSFNTVNQANKAISLADFKGEKNVLLYFYPKDDTPGCTIQANQFTALAKEYAEVNTVVLGVSKDNCDSHCKFIAKFDLQIDLLADIDGSLCESYGVWKEKVRNGVASMGIARSTFLIDKTGNLAYCEYGVSPEGHAQAMLEKSANLA